MSLHPDDLKKIQELLDWKRSFGGDFVRQTPNGTWIGSAPERGAAANTDWHPRQFRVVSEENDYLVCNPYNTKTETAGTKEVKVAKPPDMRGDLVRRGVYPNYVPNETVIWAAPFRQNGAADADDVPIVLMEINSDGRSSAWFMAKITASSSVADDHTFVEVDKDQAVIVDGRTATTAKAMNGRRGIPSDTIVFVLEIKAEGVDPLYWFTVGEGQTGTPKSLLGSGMIADTTTWDVTDQGSTKGVIYDAARYEFVAPTLALFTREITADASGDKILVNNETMYVIEASEDRNSVSGFITMVPAATDGAFIAHNSPGDNVYTLSLELQAGSGIEFDGGATSSVVYSVVVDQVGHVTATANSAQVVEISATGGGADGQGYEIIEVNDVQIDAETDGGVLNFNDTINSGTTLGVTFSGAVDGVNASQTNITATVDLSTNPPNEATDLVADVWLRVDGLATSQTVVLNASDWRGRVVEVLLFTEEGSFATVNAATWGSGTYAPLCVGVNNAAEQIVVSTIFIDGTDGGKLKMDVTGLGGAGLDVHHRILARATSQRSNQTIEAV